ncbi:MAG: hypothetical protein ACOC1F_00915, partial [Myxococcota bacterium]
MNEMRLCTWLAACALAACSSPTNESGNASDAGSQPDAFDASPDVATDAKSEAGGKDAADGASGCTSPQPGQLGPSGYPMDGWTWNRHGVVLQDPSANALDGYLAPALAVRGDVLHLWWTKKVGLKHAIWHATSSDGISFDDPVPVTGLEGDTVVAYPSVIVESDRFTMFHTAGGIDVARSDDGIAWTMVAQGVVGPGEPGSFDSLSVLYPSVSYDNGLFTMFYTGFDGQTHAIGRASSLDGLTWDK